VIGTLCVLDQEPRKLTLRQRRMLRELADAAMGLLDERRLRLTLERDAEDRSAREQRWHARHRDLLERVLDLLLVQVLRAPFASGAAAPSWYSALRDPAVGTARRALHGDPAAAWTVARLARLVGLSRAAFARRFAGAVGEPP